MAEKVMGWHLSKVGYWDWLDADGKRMKSARYVRIGGNDDIIPFRPSKYIKDAWLVFERMTGLGFCSTIGNNGNKYAAHIDCRFWNEKDRRRGIEISETAPLAICLAALKAVIVIDKTT